MPSPPRGNLSEAHPELHAYHPRGTANSLAPRMAIASSYEHRALSWQITSDDPVATARVGQFL
jgi:hypothetical protein